MALRLAPSIGAGAGRARGVLPDSAGGVGGAGGAGAVQLTQATACAHDGRPGETMNKVRLYATSFVIGMGRAVDISGSLYHDPRRKTHVYRGKSAHEALADDMSAIAEDFRRAHDRVVRKALG